jgi:hypothetical protein
MSVGSDPNSLCAKYWFGYGSWRAPYWFIGPEPGKAKDEGDNLAERCRAWLSLCPDGPESGELIDAYDHHKKFGRLEFFEKQDDKPRVPTQSTWRQLIRLVLAYEGRTFDNAAIADYQATKWGRADGETCVVELSSLATNSLATEQHRRLEHRAERVSLLRARVDEHRPRFVVMYGGGEALDDAWSAIACDDGQECLNTKMMDGFPAKFTRRGQTAFVVARHPVSHGTTDRYWIDIGEELRSGE